MAGTRTPFSVAEVKWQDYRATQTGMVVYYTSDPVSDIPIREIPEDLDSSVPPDPHYETGTYGLYACVRPKVRAAFMKNKVRWMFFVTKYEGPNATYRGKYLITGVYHIARTADARRFHIRYCKEYECLDVGTCLAFLADKVHFVGLSDAFEVTPEVLKEWNYKAKLNRQTRIILDAVHTKTLLEYLESKPDALKAYLNETKRLQPHGAEEEDESEEDVAEAAGAAQEGTAKEVTEPAPAGEQATEEPSQAQPTAAEAVTAADKESVPAPEQEQVPDQSPVRTTEAVPDTQEPGSQEPTAA